MDDPAGVESRSSSEESAVANDWVGGCVGDNRLAPRVALATLSVSSAGGALALVVTTARIADARVILLVVSTLVCYGLYWRVSFAVHTAVHEHPSQTPFGVDIDQVKTAATELTSDIHLGEATFFLDAIGQPQLVFERATERVEPLIRSVEVTTGVVLRLPRYEFGTQLVVPLLMMKRGELIDGLRLHDPEGKRIPSLSHVSMVVYIAAVIRRLVSAVMGPNALETYVTTIEDHVLEVIAREKSETHDDSVDRAMSYFRKLGSSSNDKRLVVSRLGHFLDALKNHYPVASTVRVVDSVQPALRYGVRRTVIPDRGKDQRAGWNGRLSRLSDTVRACFGVRSSTVAFPLANADRAASYHLEVHGPEDTYLARQRVFDRGGNEADLKAQQCRIQSRRGQRLAHVYIRNGVGFGERFFHATFFERMPGSVAPAAMAAVAAFAFISVTAWANLARGGGANGTDLIAVLLGFPAVASAWVGFGRSAPLLRGTLAAKAISGITILASLLAACFHILSPGSQGAGSLLARPYGHAWLVVTTVALMNSVAAVGSWLMRGLTEGHFVKREREIDRNEGVDNG